MDIKVKSLTIAVAAVVANVLFNALVHLNVLLEVSLLGKAHAATLMVALVRLVLGVASQMREVLAQGGHQTATALVVALKELEGTFRVATVNIVN
jgi:hypothetical protein